MTIINKSTREMKQYSFLQNVIIKYVLTGVLFLSGFLSTVNAQTSDKNPSLWFGATLGANSNFYRGSTQQLNSSFTAPKAFHNGFGLGLSLGAAAEYYRPNSMFGFMFHVNYDSRRGKFKDVTTPCNCSAELSTKLSYITIEPSLRIAPFKSSFYLYAGPRFAFNTNKSFVYQLKPNPAFPNQVQESAVTGDFDQVRAMYISVQLGIGYDFYLSKQDSKKQFVLSPFAAFQPYFGQSPRTIETWNITTLKIGAALKFGNAK